MEKKYNIKKIIIAVVLITLIAIPFCLLPCSAVSATGIGDYQRAYVPCDVWMYNYDDIGIAVDFKLTNNTVTFPNGNYNVQYENFGSDGSYTSAVVPFERDGEFIVATNYYKANIGYNVEYLARVKYNYSRWSSFVVNNLGTYAYGIYNYNLIPRATYVNGNSVVNRALGETIKGVRMRGNGFATNLWAMQTTTSETNQSILNTNVRIDSSHSGIVSVWQYVKFRDIKGNFYDKTYSFNIDIDDSLGFYYVGALNYTAMIEDIKVEFGDDITEEECYVYVDSFNTYISYSDSDDLELGTIQVNTCWTKDGHTSERETLLYNQELTRYVSNLKDIVDDDESNPLDDIDLVGWLADCVSGVLSINFAYGITFGGIVAVIIGFGTLFWFLRMYGGG